MQKFTADSKRVVAAIYKLFQAYGADQGILGAIGSWGDTQTDADIAEMLENELLWKLRRQKESITKCLEELDK